MSKFSELIAEVEALATAVGAEIKATAAELRSAIDYPGRQDPRPPRAYTCFADVPDGAGPATLDTGESASAAPGASAFPVVVAGQLLADLSGGGAPIASYYRTTLGAVVTRIGGRFTLHPGTGTRTDGGAAAIAVTTVPVDVSGGIDGNMPVHLVSTATEWTFGVWTDGVGLVLLGGGDYITPLVADGVTEHEMQVWITGDTALVESPDGRRTAITDSRIGDYAGAHCFWESYLHNGVTDDNAGWTHIWADTGTAVPAERQPLHRSGDEDAWGFKAFRGGFFSTIGTFLDINYPKSGFGAGKILTSDASANASWQDPTTDLGLVGDDDARLSDARTPTAHNHDDRYYTESEIDSALAAKAPLANPALTGNPTAPTQTAGTNNTRIATTAFVQTAAAAKVADTITDGTTDVAPSQNAVFDALAGKVGGAYTVVVQSGAPSGAPSTRITFRTG